MYFMYFIAREVRAGGLVFKPWLRCLFFIDLLLNCSSLLISCYLLAHLDYHSGLNSGD